MSQRGVGGDNVDGTKTTSVVVSILWLMVDGISGQKAVVLSGDFTVLVISSAAVVVDRTDSVVNTGSSDFVDILLTVISVWDVVGSSWTVVRSTGCPAVVGSARSAVVGSARSVVVLHEELSQT